MTSLATPKSFQRFSSLPVELRITVWRFALPDPRLVKVNYNVQTGRFYSTAKTPVSLQICQESRHEARNWELHFGTVGHPPQIRANLNIDTIQLEWEPIRVQAVPTRELHRIRHLAVGGMDIQRVEADTILAQLLSFRKLEHLTLVSPPPEPLCARYHSTEYSLFRSISGEHEMSARVKAELLAHSERRYMSFQQHAALVTAMFRLKDVSRRWKMPKLWLITTNQWDEMIGPCIWTLTELLGLHTELKRLGVADVDVRIVKNCLQS
ncbi:hypothetical protein ONS95_001858 [Cadophora gregata]|uniref:uncharacterized protein n=1 Tax=Cadophora gregata TaxID=51156 RepID=UPI0026DCE536|nr:uncharacterized protein ONS95_001858 [Cadophora gregata]KAK0111503.1 hypothetical protein ONS95_001858 [Cadophora gregata]KAK0112021.1 hypothetical protein ONS96_001282 [Cadophora gregata f. sp. sojae]